MLSLRHTAPTLALIILVTQCGVAEPAELRPIDGDGSRENPYEVPQTTLPIRIDGLLDDDAWADALVLELKYEVDPGENVPPPVRTEVLIIYDSDTLYAAYRCFDPDPSSIRAHLTDREEFWNDDHVNIHLDTFNDERRHIAIGVNPFGVQMDGIADSSGNFDWSWDAIWDSAGQIHEWGYAVEMAIPFNQLRFQRADGPQIWGFSAWRVVPRDVQHFIQAVPDDRNNDCLQCQFLKIRGFDRVSPGRNIEITPTVTAVRTDARSELPGGDFEELNQDAEVGLTARWGVTSNMTLSGALNPDFSQVEADALQLDINEPFALWYRERRPFFTEGADFFSTPFEVLYTRTMRDPQWGLKLTGKEGANTIGAYVVRDDITNLVFPGPHGSSAASMASANTSSVLRYRRDIWNSSTVGALMTDREGDSYYNRMLSLDARLRFSNTDSLTVQAMGSSTAYPSAIVAEYGQPQGDFTGAAWSALYEHDTRSYRLYGMYEDVGSGFRADLGYMPRVGYSMGEFGGSYRLYFDNDDFINRITALANWNQTREQNGDLIERETEAAVFFNGLLQSSYSVLYGRRIRVFSDIEFDESFLNLNANIRPLSNLGIGFWATTRDDIDFTHARAGKRNSLSAWSEINIGLHLSLAMEYGLTHFSVGGRRLFLANTLDTTIIYHFDRRTFVRAILQYVDIRRDRDLYADRVDAKSNSLFTQLLFSYKINPFTVLYVGYSDNYFGNQDFNITQTDRTFFVKLGYAWAL